MATASKLSPTTLSEDERDYLQRRLLCKLQNVPQHHLPAITLADICNQTEAVTNISNIPPELNLAWFLEHRDLIARYHDKPTKDQNVQSLTFTRAIFYYRLNKTYQFQRFHDATRWNITMFVAILTKDENTPVYNKFLHRRAHEFVVAYLEAVLEHHNHPETFTKRDGFIVLWKNSKYDLFHLTATQEKIIKAKIKEKHKDWRMELFGQKMDLGFANYVKKCGPLIDVLVPGFHSQGVLRDKKGIQVVHQEEKMDLDYGDSGFKVAAENKFMDGLRARYNVEPIGEATGKKKGKKWQEVVDVKTAIAAVDEIKPRESMGMLLRRFG